MKHMIFRAGCALASLALFAVAFMVPEWAGAAVLAAAPLTYPVVAKSREELVRQSTPESIPEGQSEAIPAILFDTELYESGVTTQATFFTTARASRRLSNLNGAGLPSPNFFEAMYFTFNARIPPAVDGTPLLDVWSLLNGDPAVDQGWPTFRFVLADKQIGPYPLLALHSLGGITGFTTNVTESYANNSTPDGSGTFCLDGAVTIPPTQTFTIEIEWPSAVTLGNGDTQIMAAMLGVLHRRVL